MAVGHGFLRSYNLVLILYIYLILGGITFKNTRKNHLASNLAITFISKELASQQLIFNRICRKRNSKKPLPISTLLLSGMRLFLNATLAVILLQLSGDVETNPGPQFEIKECRTRGLKVCHLNARSLLPKIGNLRLFVNKNPFDVIAISETKISKIHENAELILLGDFNIDYNRRSTAKSRLQTLARAFSFEQLVTSATRITETTQSIIDLIFVNNIHRIVASGVIPLDLSDHSLIYCVIKAGIAKSGGNYRDINYRCYKHYNKSSFNHDLENVDWSFLDSISDINETVNTWCNLFSETAEKHAPIKSRRVKCMNKPPWITCELTVELTYNHSANPKQNNGTHSPSSSIRVPSGTQSDHFRTIWISPQFI